MAKPPKRRDQKIQDAAGYLMEMSSGAAMLTALVLHVLEKKGLIQHADVAATIREAVDQIPEQFRAHPRFVSLMNLKFLLDDPARAFVLPFPWPPKAKP